VVGSVLFLYEELAYLVVTINDRQHLRRASDEDRHYLCRIEPTRVLFLSPLSCRRDRALMTEPVGPIRMKLIAMRDDER